MRSAPPGLTFSNFYTLLRFPAETDQTVASAGAGPIHPNSCKVDLRRILEMGCRTPDRSMVFAFPHHVALLRERGRSEWATLLVDGRGSTLCQPC